MWISEVFCSLQGEGKFLGTRSSFLRTSGCNLRCWFCDTPETSWQPVGEERTLDSLLDQLAEFGCEHVVLTGGEPLLSPDLVPLAKELRQRGHYLTVETAGTVFREIPAQLMSISPKLTNSTPRGTNWEQRHDARRHRPDVIRQLLAAEDYQLKFVVDAPADLLDVERYLEEFPEVQPEKVFLMPQGVDMESVTSKLDWLRSAAEPHGWQVSRRLHIELYGHTRGT